MALSFVMPAAIVSTRRGRGGTSSVGAVIAATIRIVTVDDLRVDHLAVLWRHGQRLVDAAILALQWIKNLAE